MRYAKQMTLGQLQDALFGLDKSMPVGNGFGGGFPDTAISFRGNYSDCAFTTSREPVSVGEFLALINKTIGSELESYKGGEFLMTENTLAWISEEGDEEGFPIMGVTLIEDVWPGNDGKIVQLRLGSSSRSHGW